MIDHGSLPRTLTRRIAVTAGACAALAAVTLPPAAQAGTLTIESGTIVYRAKPGEQNLVSVSDDRSGAVGVVDRGTGGPMTLRDSSCSRVDRSIEVLCPRSAFSAVRVELGDGDDTFAASDRSPISVDAGPGDDVFSGVSVRVNPLSTIPAPSQVDFDGGAGRDHARFFGVNDLGVTVTLDGRPNDGRPGDRNNVRGVESLEGSPQGDTLVGTPAAETFVSGAGPDVYEGRDGDDVFLMGRVRDGATRVLAGGGRDVVSYAERTAPLNVSPDDAAFADGEGGEGDQVFGAEVVEGGSAGDNIVTHPQATAGYRLIGNAGNDVLSSADGADRLIGGVGADFMFSGGRADTVEARNGDLDTIDCGTNGDDTAFLDRGEARVRNCETRLVPLPFIGVPRMAPRAVTAAAGRPAQIAVDWTHPVDWRRLASVTLTLSAGEGPVGRVVLEGRRRVRATGAVRLVPGTAKVRVAGGRRVALRAAVRIDRRYAGRTLDVTLAATDRRGRRQAPRPVGTVHLARR